MTLPVLPSQPSNVPWPTDEWPVGAPPRDRAAALSGLMDRAFSAVSTPELDETHAVIVIQGGRLVFERYGEGRGPGDTAHSWSMAKSITHALTGLLVGDGKLDITAPADVAEWREPGDPRAAITLDQLLRMSSGLAFREDYSPDHPSDVIEMLFGAGKGDVAHFAADFPLAHAPGAFMAYSSGTTNIVSRCLSQAAGAFGPDFEAFMRRRLFEPLGMASANPKFDAAGTFIGSSYCFCTPRDFARFGLLYLRDGIWEDRRLLPPGWADYARTPTFQQAGCVDGPYGAHFWLGLAGEGGFSANGYDGQRIVIDPARDLVLVRNGKTSIDKQTAIDAWLAELVDCFG